MFFEGRNVPLFDFLDTLSLSFIYKNERRQRCHDQKITVKGGFSNRTYLYEVEDGIDFFDAVRKASAEFVNTPDGRKIYYKKGSFSWLDFSLLFVAAGAGDQFGGLLGYDSFEGDYFGINCMDAWAEDEAKKKLKQLTKDKLIAAIRQCFRVYQSFIGLSVRYDSLKAAINILRDKNTGILQVVKEIERLYEAASSEQGIYAEYSKTWKEFDQYTESLPPETWVS